ncbi:MAG: glutaminyl-peptide cyclotransferase [Microbacteriaceae bacterium]
MWRVAVRSVAASVVLISSVTAGAPVALAEPAPVIIPAVVAVLPHDRGAYSEGLEFDGPALYEATGEVGKSELRQVNPVTGAVVRAVPLPGTYFGEGIAVVGESIWQLTYRDGVAIEWDKASFTALREVPVAGQGWGLCHDGARFISSDGSDRLRFHDGSSFGETGSIQVTRDGQPVSGLNELECVDGQVWAAAWPNDTFVRIDPGTGAVNLVADMSNLWPAAERGPRQVVSGIAHIAGSEYLISGKEWPQSYRVVLP